MHTAPGFSMVIRQLVLLAWRDGHFKADSMEETLSWWYLWGSLINAVATISIWCMAFW